jgi:hypothetical protein
MKRRAEMNFTLNLFKNIFFDEEDQIIYSKTLSTTITKIKIKTT